MIYNYSRRKASMVTVGDVRIGGSCPVAIQSMTNCNTNDTPSCVAQCLAVARAGGDIVRLTTQGMKEAANMANVKEGLLEAGCSIPIVADVHFNPAAAYEAARTSDKVRINPGNFVASDDPQKIRAAVAPLLETCRRRGVAIRLGVNHGSLSRHMMDRYGDTPLGMVESAMEFLRIFREENFHNVVISIKSSNTSVMIETVLLLADTMAREGMEYPLHLGVTEAGDGEDGRVKSAVGIGTLLAMGIGDTIRVSLSEPPENEVPVAVHLRDYIASRAGHAPIAVPATVLPGKAREHSVPVPGFESVAHPIALGVDFNRFPEGWHIMDASESFDHIADDMPIVLGSRHQNPLGEMASFIDRLNASGRRNPVILRREYSTGSLENLQVEAGADFGALLFNGYGSGIAIEAPAFSAATLTALSLSVLQAARLRISKTEYIACPSCGRTLFDLPATLRQVKETTSHLKGLKIGVMGCIVNGPGEMADADYGYVGAGPGRVSLYKGKQLIVKNIPSEEALPRLIALIKENGDWQEP